MAQGLHTVHTAQIDRQWRSVMSRSFRFQKVWSISGWRVFLESRSRSQAWVRLFVEVDRLIADPELIRNSIVRPLGRGSNNLVCYSLRSQTLINPLPDRRNPPADSKSFFRIGPRSGLFIFAREKCWRDSITVTLRGVNEQGTNYVDYDLK